MALESELLGAHALGVRDILALTGDPPRVGDYPTGTGIWDVDSIGLIGILARLNRGEDQAGKPIGAPAGFTIACALDPTADDLDQELDRLTEKIDAGAHLIMTQPIYAREQWDALMEVARQRAGRAACRGRCCWASCRFTRSATPSSCTTKCPGITIPAEIRAAMGGAGERAAEVGLDIAHALLAECADQVQGTYVMPSFGRYELAAELVRRIRADCNASPTTIGQLTRVTRCTLRAARRAGRARGPRRACCAARTGARGRSAGRAALSRRREDNVRVYDYADVLSPATEAQATQTIAAIENRTGAEVAIYTQYKPGSDEDSTRRGCQGPARSVGRRPRGLLRWPRDPGQHESPRNACPASAATARSSSTPATDIRRRTCRTQERQADFRQRHEAAARRVRLRRRDRRCPRQDRRERDAGARQHARYGAQVDAAVGLDRRAAAAHPARRLGQLVVAALRQGPGLPRRLVDPDAGSAAGPDRRISRRRVGGQGDAPGADHRDARPGQSRRAVVQAGGRACWACTPRPASRSRRHRPTTRTSSATAAARFPTPRSTRWTGCRASPTRRRATTSRPTTCSSSASTRASSTTASSSHVASRGWFSEPPAKAVNRWAGRGTLAIVGGVVVLIIGFNLPSQGLVLMGAHSIAAGILIILISRSMPQRTMAGAMIYAMLAAYRRTLQRTMEQARSMNQVVQEANLAWIETPDQATVWGVALGLQSDVEAVIERSAEDAQQGVSTYNPWVPIWYGTGWSSGGAQPAGRGAWHPDCCRVRQFPTSAACSPRLARSAIRPARAVAGRAVSAAAAVAAAGVAAPAAASRPESERSRPPLDSPAMGAVETMEQFFELLNSGDRDNAVKLMDDKVEMRVHVLGSSRTAASGVDQVSGWFTRADKGLQMIPGEVRDTGVNYEADLLVLRPGAPSQHLDATFRVETGKITAINLDAALDRGAVAPSAGRRRCQDRRRCWRASRTWDDDDLADEDVVRVA